MYIVASVLFGIAWSAVDLDHRLSWNFFFSKDRNFTESVKFICAIDLTITV